MSRPVDLGCNVQGTHSRGQRAKSLIDISVNNKGHPSLVASDEIGQEPRAAGFGAGELLLPNGDSYSGSFLGGMPEGLGVYVWLDGSVYEGEWRRGMKHGNGRMQWPSGVIYEGEFSGGYMHGTGTLLFSDSKIYNGQWRLNLKHGFGLQVYASGDIFEGAWNRGTPSGPGKYTWANGNVYFGSMKEGKMSGTGTLTWGNGDSFEGSWLNGMMHGFGVYTWSDGGCYVGTWDRGLKDGKGAFYPKGSRLPAMQELYLTALRKRGLLPDSKNKILDAHFHHYSPLDMGADKVGKNLESFRLSSDQLLKGNPLNLEQVQNKNILLGRQWSLDASIEKTIGHDLSLGSSESILKGGEKDIYANVPILEREYMQGVLISELVLNNNFSTSSKRAKKRQKKHAKEIKRPGETIIKGHRSYDLMLSLQLGIRYTVGKITPIQRREVRKSDFGPQASFWMSFPREGSKLTPSHQSEDFKWKDYCPMVFRDLREMFKIDAGDYMISICGNDALRELSSPGKSGSMFFLSQDDHFMIKTLRKSEVKVLLRMLPKYHHHVRFHENTLLTKFFGLHRIIPPSGQKFRFVVMGNMFCTELRIHRRFDLKGSSLGRSTDKIEIDANTTLKDLDLNYCFYLEPSWRETLINQIQIDSKFLEAQQIMDYSLLLGVHYRAPRHVQPLYNQTTTSEGLGIVVEEDALEDEMSNYPQGLVLVPLGSEDGSVVVGSHIRGSRLRASSAAGEGEVDLLLPGTASRLQIQLGVNMPARAERIPGKVEKGAQMFHETYDVVLYLGIIDILQEYNMSKKIEHAFKSIQFDSLSISAVDPTFYSQRLLEFIRKVFPSNA